MSMHRGFTVAGQLARRSLVACAISSLVASTALTPLSAAFAQNQQSPGQQPANQQVYPGPPITAQNQAGDPPARVGRISKINGTVSFHTADEDQWGPATLNYPLTNGNALWTEPGARAELQLGSANRLVMDGKTELNLTTLDDTAFEASLPQGSAYVNLQDVAPGESYTIRTPRGSVQLSQPGRYAITAGDDDTPTTVTTLAGAPAQLAERGLTQSVPAGQTATLNGPLDGDDPIKAAVAPGQPSAFAQSAMAEERQVQAAAPPPPVPNVAAVPAPSAASTPVPSPAPVPAAMPVQVQGMTGAQDLAAYGTWSSAPQYGSVWYPPVQAGWVPYRHGHWAWVHPWGWTWVADEPWGFAPFHYGRWVMVHDRWAWSPGFHHRHHHHRPRPVYAPALVAFFGGGGGSGVSVSVAIGRDVGWVPLGWHEPYYPPYRVSRNYIRNVNVTHVTNITKVTNVTVNNTTVNRYVNRNSATFVQADTMRHSRPVQQAVQSVDDRQMQSMRSERRPQVQPERQRQMQAAPGPRIDQAALRRNEPGRDDQHMQRSNGQRNTPPREVSRRQDQPQMMRQEQARPQEQQRMPDRQRQEQQRQEPQRQDRQPQQVQRDQPRQVQQQERQHSEMQRQEPQRQPQAEQRQMPQQNRQRQEGQHQEQRQQSQQREQQMRQQADQQRQMQQQERQRGEIQREQQAQQQRQHQEIQRQQVQREQQMRQQADQQRQQAEQQRQQVQQEQRRQQETQGQVQNQRQQQEQRQQRRREADL